MINVSNDLENVFIGDLNTDLQNMAVGFRLEYVFTSFLFTANKRETHKKKTPVTNYVRIFNIHFATIYLICHHVI